MMHKPKDTLAREMTVFCRQRGGRRRSQRLSTSIAQAVLGVVVSALLAPRDMCGPCWGYPG